MFRVIACIFASLLVSGLAAAQIIPIDDIQEYLPNGTPSSPDDGQTVTVRGSVYITHGTINQGLHYIQGTTGGIKFHQPGRASWSAT